MPLGDATFLMEIAARFLTDQTHTGKWTTIDGNVLCIAVRHKD